MVEREKLRSADVHFADVMSPYGQTRASFAHSAKRRHVQRQLHRIGWWSTRVPSSSRIGALRVFEGISAIAPMNSQRPRALPRGLDVDALAPSDPSCGGDPLARHRCRCLTSSSGSKASARRGAARRRYRCRACASHAACDAFMPASRYAVTSLPRLGGQQSRARAEFQSSAANRMRKTWSSNG